MKTLKGFGVIVLVLLVLIVLVGSCSDTEEEPVTEPEETVGEPNATMVLPSYDVAEIEDVTFSNVKRFNWKVVVHDEVTKEELIMLSEHIV